MTDPIVATASGAVRGRIVDGIAVFKGLPYAAAPEGAALRFAAPTPVENWDGVREAGRFGTAPPQLAPAPGAPPVWQPSDGLDCLNLNVWSPDLGAVGLPVMVWLYGGLWKHGATSMPQYDAGALAACGVVVVTVNYRVGFEGFGHLPGRPDNRGLRDQIAALVWVQDNIAAFGGDPGTVTLAGQSAGAAATAYLMGAPAAAGLFGRAITQSVPAGMRTVAEAEQASAAIARAAGIEATCDGFTALAPAAILAVQDAPLTGRDSGLTAFGPVVDGDLVTGPVWEAAAAGAARGVELLCGFTEQEYLGQGGPPLPPGVDLAVVAEAVGLSPEAADGYRLAYPGVGDAELFTTMLSDALVRIPTLRTAQAHTAAGGATWLYDLAWRSPGLGAAHGLDVPLVFGTLHTRFAARYLGTPPPDGAQRLSEQMRQAWTGFAATGDPGWPRHDLDHHRARVWDTPPRDVEDPLAGSRRVWLSQTADD